MEDEIRVPLEVVLEHLEKQAAVRWWSVLLVAGASSTGLIISIVSSIASLLCIAGCYQ